MQMLQVMFWESLCWSDLRKCILKIKSEWRGSGLCLQCNVCCERYAVYRVFLFRRSCLWMKREPPSCMHVAVPLLPAHLTGNFPMMQFIKPMLSARLCLSANVLLFLRLTFPQLRRDSFCCNWRYGSEKQVSKRSHELGELPINAVK